MLGSDAYVLSGSELEAMGVGVEMDSPFSAVCRRALEGMSPLNCVESDGVMSWAVVLCRGFSDVDARVDLRIEPSGRPAR